MQIEITSRNKEQQDNFFGFAPLPDNGRQLKINNYVLNFTESEFQQMQKDISEQVETMLYFTRWCDRKLDDYVKLLSYGEDRLEAIEKRMLKGEKNTFNHENEIIQIFSELLQGNFKSTKELFDDKEDEKILTTTNWQDTYKHKHFYQPSLEKYAKKQEKPVDVLDAFKDKKPFVNIRNASILVGFSVREPIVDGNLNLQFYDLPMDLKIEDGATLLTYVVPELAMPFIELRSFYQATKDVHKHVKEKLSPYIEDGGYFDFSLDEQKVEYIQEFKKTIYDLIEDVLKLQNKDTLENTEVKDKKVKVTSKP